jgi:TetR/AcrR family fatty acid metabolism transcriptional regulator
MANILVVRSEVETSGQEDRSFIEKQRRSQIVQCAIEAIAELGYANASLAEIAKRAGVSKGVISYHFAGKRELIQQVIQSILEKANDLMVPRVFAEQTAAGRLRAYIESNLEFLGANRKSTQAILNIVSNARDDDGKPTIDPVKEFSPAVSALQTLFRYGQKTGEFRKFSTLPMAVTVRSAIDAVAALTTTVPDLDLKAYTNELVTLFDMATRKPPA